MPKKKIHIAVTCNGEEGTHSSFYFWGASVGQLSMLNHELDILKSEIIERLKAAPKDYEIKEFEEGEDEEDEEDD